MFTATLRTQCQELKPEISHLVMSHHVLTGMTQTDSLSYYKRKIIYVSLAKLTQSEHQNQGNERSFEFEHRCKACSEKGEAGSEKLKYISKVKNTLVQDLLSTDCCRTDV